MKLDCNNCFSNISKNHSNRRAHNWLAYKVNDKFLQRGSRLYKGVLYDLGCEESPYKDFFLRYADQYVGVDWGSSYHDIKADIVADLNKPLPIESEVADTVVSLSVLEHLCEPQTMLDEAFRILKPGGWIVLQTPFQWWVHEAPYDFFRYTPYGLSYLLGKAGFVNVTVEPMAGFFSMIILKMIYFSARFIRGPKLVRGLLRLVLAPFWYLGQCSAPLLDKLDRNRAAEASGYWVEARKL